jgi:hypothetical protein
METRSTGILAGFVPERDLAEELGVTVRTISRWRKKQIGPPHTTAGREIIYNVESTRAWLAAGGTSTPAAKPCCRKG